jgi:HEAT repeat protein
MHPSDTTHTENLTEITVFLLNYLISAPAKMINTVFQLLRAKSAPEIILETSFEAYKTTNQERYLTVAKSLLEDFGNEAWPTLRSLSRSKHPECDLFVRLIAQCAEVPATERAEALIDIAKHPNKYVRSQVPEFLPLFGKEDQIRILQVLLNDTDPEIKEEAEEYFSVHSG